MKTNDMNESLIKALVMTTVFNAIDLVELEKDKVKVRPAADCQ